MSKKKAVFIVGPTGVGKSGLAVKVAEELGTEIISTDSRQVYKELNIGTAVPPPELLKRVRHHLVCHRSVKDYYNAAMFEEEALVALKGILNRVDTAVLAGGSGLYINAVLYGIDDIPSVDPRVREKLLKRLEAEGVESLRFELKRLDPLTYKRIDLRNPNRILKALEVCLSAGKPYSDFLTHEKKARDFEAILVGLNMERKELYDKINTRVDEMMEAGLLDEVRNCLEYRHSNALKTVGYRELFDFIDGLTTLAEAVRLIKRDTRHYARRQITWFNKYKDIQWFTPGQTEEIVKYITNATR